MKSIKKYIEKKKKLKKIKKELKNNFLLSINCRPSIPHDYINTVVPIEVKIFVAGLYHSDIIREDIKHFLFEDINNVENYNTRFDKGVSTLILLQFLGC